MKHRRRKGIRGLILALATAAIVVPAASGKIYEGGSTGYVEVSPTRQAQGYTPQALKAMSERYSKMAQAYQHAGNAVSASGSYGGLYPGSGAGPGSTVIVTGSTRPDDRAGIRGPSPVETPTVVSLHGDGFDWTDAGIGASVAVLIAAILASVTLIRRRTGLAV
jgi:hypothetical protein